MRRALGEAPDPVQRAALLPAFVEVMLATGENDEAERAAAELEEIAAGSEGGALPAAAAQARGAVRLARGDAQGALTALRRRRADLAGARGAVRGRPRSGARRAGLPGARRRGHRRARAGRRTRTSLRGSAPGRTSPASAAAQTPETHGLTARELEVLRLVAAGRSNRDIAEALVISEHTVARHVQNIFGKLGVSSRTAAGAFAFEHGLV